MKMGKRRLTCLLAAIMMTLFAACGAAQGGAAQSAGSGETQEAASATRAFEQVACDAGAAAGATGIDILADIQYNCCVWWTVWAEPDAGERSGYGTL